LRHLQIASDRFRLSPWTPPATECNITTMISRGDYHESKSIHHGGGFMNRSKSLGGCRVLASTAMLFGAVFTILLLPAYGQQEVAPTWYDPWAAPNAAVVPSAQPPGVVHASQAPVATHRYQQTARSLSPAPDARKFRVKATQVNQSGHNAARKSRGTPSGEAVLAGTDESAESVESSKKPL
jgi:hypothetical protein